jgi:hypothetical protein
MTLNDKIAKLGSRFKKMNIAEGIIFLTVNFPQDWKINDKILEKHNVKVMPTEDYEGYYFAATLDVGIDSIFNAIDDTITFNEVAGIKKALFLEKVSELQRIFEEEPLDVLQTIEFKYKKKKPKNLKKNETDNIENEEEVAVCQAG